MNENDVYEQWKTQRGEIKAPAELVPQILESIAADDESAIVAEPTKQPVKQTLLSVLAVLAASVLGLLRIGFAFLFGIS